MSRTSIALSSGALFDLCNPDPALITVDVLANHLSRVNRFAGAAAFSCGTGWSVAAHSLLVRAIVAEETGGDPAAELWALLHDGHEAFIGDVTTPAQHALGTAGKRRLKNITDALDWCLQRRFQFSLGATFRVTDAVARADKIAMMTERDALWPADRRPTFSPEYEALPRWPVPLSPFPAWHVRDCYARRLGQALERYHGKERAAA